MMKESDIQTISQEELGARFGGGRGWGYLLEREAIEHFGAACMADPVLRSIVMAESPEELADILNR